MLSSVARQYANALFSLLGSHDREPTRATLVGLSQALAQSPAFRQLVVSPAFHPEEKLAVLSALADRFHALPVVKNLLGVLVAKGRIQLLPEITKAFVALIEHGQGTRHITVLSARELDTTEQEQLRYRLHELLRRDVSVTFQTEPRLLGGLTIRIGSHLYDSSVRSRLNAMQTLLTGE